MSSSKNMALIYDNMTKLFDVFTKGALLGQGSNSEILLRQVYRALNDDFINIVADSKAVDKIVELMKTRQDGLTPENMNSAMVSNTTKKVVTKTLDPNNVDLMQVVVDFIDELQTSILQVKLSLSREYERQKFVVKKGEEGQKQDIDQLNSVLQQQTDTMVSTLKEMQKQDEDFATSQKQENEDLFKTFGIGEDGKIDDGELERIVGGLEKDKEISGLLNVKDNKLEKLIKQINGFNPPKRGEAGKTNLNGKMPK